MTIEEVMAIERTAGELYPDAQNVIRQLTAETRRLMVELEVALSHIDDLKMDMREMVDRA